MSFKGFAVGGGGRKRPFGKKAPFGKANLSSNKANKASGADRNESATTKTETSLSIFGDRDDEEKEEERRRKLRRLDDDDNHDNDDDEGGNRNNTDSNEPVERKVEEEEDPLDAFMSAIHEQKDKPKEKTGTRAEFEEKDDMEEFLARHAERREKEEELGEELQYDDQDRLIHDPNKKKLIQPLPPVYHSQIEYEPFEKELYDEHPEVTAMSDDEVRDLRKQCDIRVTGEDYPRPVRSFEQLSLDDSLSKVIAKQGYTEPTPIQKQGIPTALSGRDIIGIAKTGSGKTLAFVLPMVVHIMCQRVVESGEGPIGLIIAPTRELAHQIFLQTKIFAKAYGVRVAPVYGGASKYEQVKELKEGVEVVVCTPGRLIDVVKKKATSLQRVTYVVLDEADRMFDMGFEPQVRSIVGQVRPDRHTLLFSATFKHNIEKLAREILTNPVRIAVGRQGEANEDINQRVVVLEGDHQKWSWLMGGLKQRLAAGHVLIFVAHKGSADELAENLNKFGFLCDALHGDRSQDERSAAIRRYKKGQIRLMVATDVAARGLDIKEIKTVVNFDPARNIESHVHRIGRTGRAGSKDGVAYTLITPKNVKFAGDLVWNLDGANQHIPKDLLTIAQLNPRFKYRKGMKRRERSSVPMRGGMGGGRGGFKRVVAGVGFAAPQAPDGTTPNMIGGSGISIVTPSTTVVAAADTPIGIASEHPANVRAAYESNFVKAAEGGEGGSWAAAPTAASRSAPSQSSSQPSSTHPLTAEEGRRLMEEQRRARMADMDPRRR